MYLYFYAILLEREGGAYYYRYERRRFECEQYAEVYVIEKDPASPFYLDSVYTKESFKSVHGVKNQWYAYVVLSEDDEMLAKSMLYKELERRKRNAIELFTAADIFLEVFLEEKSQSETERE